MAIFKGVPMRYLNESGFSRYQQVFSLHTSPLYIIPMQYKYIIFTYSKMVFLHTGVINSAVVSLEG